MKKWWAIPIIAMLMVVGTSVDSAFASHLPVPEVVSVYPEPRQDIQAWVFHIKYQGKSHFVPTNPLGMGAPQEYGLYVDDWSDWGHDPLPHWIFWSKDWQGKTHYYTGLGQVIRRTVSPDGTQDGIRGESVFAGKIRLADGKVAYNCYARALPQDFQISEWGDINPWPREHTNEHVNTPYCVFALPVPPTPTPTPQPQIAACSDGYDNDADGWRDADDPGCHWDGNSENPGSYNPQDNDEWDATPCCPPPPQVGCVATQESWTPRYGTDWYPGRSGAGLVEVHVWWPGIQERKLLLETWQRPGFINGGGSAWSWPVGCEQQARSAFQNQATWIPQVTLDQLRNEGRIR